MEIKIQVPFQQLLEIVRSLSPAQKARLRQELTEEDVLPKEKDEYIAYLLGGPVFSEEEIENIEENRKSIAEWRTNT